MRSTLHRDRLLAVLTECGGPVCDDCGAQRSGIRPRQQVNSLAAQLAAAGAITRDRAVCEICGRIKITSGIHAAASAESRPLGGSSAESSLPAGLGAGQVPHEHSRTNDEYGKAVLARAAGGSFRTGVSDCRIAFQAGYANIDGVVGQEVAVEIEARNAKQVRGAILDLVMHRYPKKLLVLIPSANMNTTTAAAQCQHILSEFLPPGSFRVAVLGGTCKGPDMYADVERVRRALAELAAMPQS